MPPKVNNILGFYTEDGRQVTADRPYSYAQIELLGSHARGVKRKATKKTTKTVDSNDIGDIYDVNKDSEPEADGYIMLVSREDLNLVMNYQWYLTSNGYPGTYGSIHAEEENWGAPYSLHRFLVLNVPEGHVVDHINRNRLDNRRSNLRVITAKQNSYNRKKPKNAKGKYKGVRKMGGGKFKAVISKDGKTYQLKDCATEKDAAIAYDYMAEELFGPHAGKNFPH
jgi:HNH endonuclease